MSCLTRRQLMVGTLLTALGPLAARFQTVVARIDARGLGDHAWRLIHRFGGHVFSRYSEATSRSTGYLGFIENRYGVVVGWVDRQGGIWRSVWLESGRGYNVARDAGIVMRRVGDVR